MAKRLVNLAAASRVMKDAASIEHREQRRSFRRRVRQNLQRRQALTHRRSEGASSESGLQPSKDIDVVVFSTSPRTNLGSEADFLIAADGRFTPPGM
jgi:hypothetical protein